MPEAVTLSKEVATNKLSRYEAARNGGSRSVKKRSSPDRLPIQYEPLSAIRIEPTETEPGILIFRAPGAGLEIAVSPLPSKSEAVTVMQGQGELAEHSFQLRLGSGAVKDGTAPNITLMQGRDERHIDQVVMIGTGQQPEILVLGPGIEVYRIGLSKDTPVAKVTSEGTRTFHLLKPVPAGIR